MKLFENSVGRPTNEILKKRKIFYAVIITLAIVVVGTLGIILNKNFNNLKGSTVSSNTISVDKITKNSFMVHWKAKSGYKASSYTIYYSDSKKTTGKRKESHIISSKQSQNGTSPVSKLSDNTYYKVSVKFKGKKDEVKNLVVKTNSSTTKKTTKKTTTKKITTKKTTIVTKTITKNPEYNIIVDEANVTTKAYGKHRFKFTFKTDSPLAYFNWINYKNGAFSGEPRHVGECRKIAKGKNFFPSLTVDKKMTSRSGIVRMYATKEDCDNDIKLKGKGTFRAEKKVTYKYVGLATEK